MAESRDNKIKIVPQLRKVTNDLYVRPLSAQHITLLDQVKNFHCEENSVDGDTESLLGAIDKNDIFYKKSNGNSKDNKCKKLTSVQFTDQFQSVMSKIRMDANVSNTSTWSKLNRMYKYAINNFFTWFIKLNTYFS